MIITANHWFGHHPTKPMPTWAEWWQSVVLPASTRQGITMHIPSDDPFRMAQVRQGNWIILCACHGAEYAWEEGLFVCLSCFNARHGHRIADQFVQPRRRERRRGVNERACSIPNRDGSLHTFHRAEGCVRAG